MYADSPRRSSRRRPDLNIDTSPPVAFSTRPSAVAVASRESAAAAAAPPVPQTPPSNRNRPPPPSSSSSVAKGKSSSRALRGPALSRHADDSLLDTPESPDSFDMSANKENDNPDLPRPRDSHDLSLSPRNVTRDSLMANMLISLDQFTMAGPIGGPFVNGAPDMLDEPPQQYQYDTDGDGFSRSVRGGRANGHSYSYSSDFDADDASRISSRGRRSNSSSNFQPGLHRISSMREPLRSTPGTSRHMHSRGRKGSAKSSSSNSIDAGYAQVLSSTRWASGFGGRSSSFDYGHRPPALQATTQQQQQQQQAGGAPWHIEFSNNFFADNYDAAPTPTVPGGPRRMMPPVTPPAATNYPPSPGPAAVPLPAVEPIEPLPPVTLERKRSNRSAKSTSTNHHHRKAENNPNNPHHEAPPPPLPMSVPAVPAPSTAAASAASSSPAPSSVPAFEIDSAPAPHVGYGKTKEAVHGAQVPTQAPSQTKEKPGFFRRVFGSSRNNASSNQPETQNSTAVSVPSSTSVVDTADQRSGNKSLHVASQMKSSGSAPPSRDTSSSHSHHHVLQKKPSSFFRRRKKSVSADDVPPMPAAAPIEPPMPPLVPPIQLSVPKDKLSAKPEPSPISSLRRVMNPYLKGSPVTPNTPLSPHSAGAAPVQQSANPEMASDSAPASRTEAPEEQPRSFSPDYDPSPNARIREVRSASRGGGGDDDGDGDDDSQPEYERRTDTPTRPPPEPPVSTEKRNNSFLDIDGSDNEADTESRRGNKTRREKGSISGRKIIKDSSPSRKGASDGTDDTIRGRKNKNNNGRLAVAQADSDDEGNRPALILPIEGTRSASRASGSTTTEYKSAISGTPSVRIEASANNSPKVLGTFESMSSKPLDEPDFVVGDPTEDDRQKAKKIFDGNEDFIQKQKAAAWMGEEGPVRQRTLQAYMDLYDFTNKSILQSLRLICQRLVFRAETQQVDRILVAFSKRWCDCNANHGFKASDVIHTICYSIMLLNTDLHLADIEQKMTRSQFVKNTMTTIVQAVAEAVPDAFERPTILPGKSNSALGADDSRTSIEERFTSRRLSFRPPPRHEGDGSGDHCHDECGPLVKAPFDGSMRAWEHQVEIVLKDIYASIRDERLPLFGADPSKNLAPNPQSSLSVMGMLKRTPSVLSKAPSESQASMRGRIAENGRANSSRWNSKSRSRPRMGNPGFSSSRTSFEDGNSVWSPTVSSATWSKLSLGRTQTSMSVDSLSSSFCGGDYQQSIGFANALSQAVIRDDESGLGKEPSIMSDELKPAHLLEDESLELAGPPWVKEGMVIHKHHLDGIEKKAKDRHWNEVFAVIQRGQMSIFSFGTNKSAARKSRGRHAAKGPAIVGGGNWQENATNLGTFSLRQTLASTLPPPGYSRARPHVWALSLPTGAVHLFQVGTPEISKEFVTTANYWSARLSTHPLVGGISNIEYGWSDAIINNALVTAINEQTVGPSPGRQRSNSRPGSSAANNRPSISSFRSGSLDHGPGGPYSSASRGNKLPGDRIHIADWAPPTQSMRPSNLPEEEQLDSLLAYVKGIEDELQVHNQLRSPMLLAFTPRGNNAVRAMANWERKSAYLLREIVKFRTYVDCLQQAGTRKNEIYTERDLARRAARGELDEGEIEFDAERDTSIRA
ncbi:Putative Sec7 domain, PH-like domain superfamily, sec7 domain superfamily, pleckstrin domain 9 [Colletotrichum destructivum]|uniref:Sec7 domain, PH-like domain superfamily, sec7 domain superfamily, pleckstrin domain 9 n=1 Tax=Colletotrichum destructivum TaxID=34406 RepID=A0AAX4I6B4_9PEZI|nr:Putative Sec7 domain, PH-like domain superfamily, sec7 domain superfamily, pleckstrin domain 9 [Colletotrichum destructivum]